MPNFTVIGAGLLGVKIAGELIYHGHRVKIYDRNLEMLNSVYERLQEDKKNLLQEGLIVRSEFDGQLLCMSHVNEAVCDADIIFEAISENLTIKQNCFEEVSHACKPRAIIASNTLQLDINEVTRRAKNKDRILGIRFLFPVYHIPEVEITPGKHTSLDTINEVRTTLEGMGKTLFFRCGSKPLILSEEQIQERKMARISQIRNSSTSSNKSLFPRLSLVENSYTDFDDVFVPNLRESERDCAICMDHTRDCLLAPCHHMILCRNCAGILLNRNDHCPVCRSEIKEIIKVYNS